MGKKLGSILIVGALLLLELPVFLQRQVQRGVLDRQAQGPAAGTARIEVPEHSGVVVTLPGLIADTWSQLLSFGFEATVKGEDPLRRLLEVPPGVHRVEVHYEHDSYLSSTDENVHEQTAPVEFTVNFVVGHRYRFNSLECQAPDFSASAIFWVEDAADGTVVAGSKACPPGTFDPDTIFQHFKGN
jgi:hypothetical protein